MVYPSNRIGRVIAVMVLGALSMCTRAQAQLFSASQNISRNADFSTTPQVAADGAGNIYAAWEDDTANNANILFTRSTDGGKTFSTPKNLSNTSGFSSNPRVAIDAHGVIYVAWEDDATGNLEIFVSQSSDGGLNFSTPTNVSNDPADSEDPQLAVDAFGNVDVVWNDKNITMGIFFAQSTDGGKTYSTPKNLASNLNGSFVPQMAVGQDGSISVAWEDDSATGQPSVSFAHSSDKGVTFSAAQKLSTGGAAFGAQLAVDASGNINVVWMDSTLGNQEIFFSRSMDQGVTFSAPSDVSKGTGSADNPQIGTDANGSIYVVWQDDVPPMFSRDIYFARSGNGGVTFSAGQNLSNSTGDSTAPSLTVDAKSNIGVAWQEVATGRNHIFFTRSGDGGNTFDPVQDLSNDSGRSSEVQVAEDTKGNLNAVWADNTPGVSQIFYSNLPNPKPANLPPVANAGADQTLECAGPNGNVATLDGSASSDPDGDALTYLWQDQNGNPVGSSAVVQVTVGMGVNSYTLTVTDAGGLSSTATTHVTVQDTTPPTLQVSVSPTNLWPANHKLVSITATVATSDVCDPHPAVQLVSITSNDPNTNAGDIQAAGGGPVAFGTDVRSFSLRADRGPKNAPRVYTITYQAKDASGNATTASAQVSVGPQTTPTAGPLRLNGTYWQDGDKDKDRGHKGRRDRDRD